MKIDSAIKNFSEKYNRDMITSIDHISKDRALNLKGATINLHNMAESVNSFVMFLEGYSGYLITNIGKPEISPHEVIKENFNAFIKSDENFKEASVKYSDLPAYVQSYVEGINKILESVDKVKREMSEAEIYTEAIADVNDFVDSFMDRMDESFSSDMDQMLWASGYNSAMRLFKNRSPKKKENAVVFI